MKKYILLVLFMLCLNNITRAESIREIISFDKGWLFARYGLQSDGSRIAEPGNVLNYKIIGSSEEPGSGTMSQHAIDNEMETSWQPSKKEEKPWIVIDFKKTTSIKDCRVRYKSGKSEVKIEGSNDKTSWQEPFGKYRYYRITFTKDDVEKSPLIISEVELIDENGEIVKNSLIKDKSPKETDFKDANWRKLDIPHDWGIEGPFRLELDGYTGKLPWRGIGWYRKHFKVDKQDEGKVFYLDFDGVMANAEIWLNGEKIGERPYGYSSFRVDLTQHISYKKKNVIAVRVNTEKMGSRWYPGAGIYRHVRLIKTDPVHVNQWGVFVTTPHISNKSAEAMVEVNIKNNNSSKGLIDYNIEVYEIDENDVVGKKIATHNKRDIYIEGNSCLLDTSRIIIDNPQLWGLEKRNRYLAKVLVSNNNTVVDSYETTFGIRRIEFTHNNGFLLNGKRVDIKGVCNHHDLGALGTAINTSALERQLKILKSFGCNAIRTAHNPPAPELLTLSDKMGFLIMDEIFDCWRAGKKINDYSSIFEQWHEKDIEALVCRDRNHPSVILWSTGNEVSEQYYPEKGVARYLTDLVHKYDNSRPVTFGASYPSKSAMNGTELQVDVHGMNYPAGVYGGPDFFGEFLNKEGHETIVGYVSESSSTLSSRGEYFPKEFQMSSYDLREPGWGSLPDQEFAALDKYPAICGEFVWTGFDYLGEPTPFNSDNSVLLNHAAAITGEEMKKEIEKLKKIEQSRPSSRSSYFGIVDLAGFPKDRYYLYKARWMPDEPMVHILPHWNFPERVGVITPVFVYSSGDEVELFLNGESLGKKKRGEYEYRFRWEDVVYTPGELKAIAYKNGEKWSESSVATTGKAKKIVLSTDKQSIDDSGDELVFITISICDENGRVVPTADNLITCKIDGGGEIVATDNGDATSLITFSKPSKPVFNGLMLAIIKVKKGNKKSLTFTAESRGLIKAEIDIEVK